MGKRYAHSGLKEELEKGFEVIGEGMSSTVLRAPDGDIYKYGRSTTAHKAQKLAERSSRNVALVLEYLGGYATPTLVSVAGGDDAGYHVVHHQPYIEGLSIGKQACDVEQLMELFERALRMYDRTGFMPDIACVESGWFDPLKSPNILVLADGTPRVVDTDLGRTQQAPVIGLMWNWLMSEGVVRAKFDLSERRATFSLEPGCQAA